MLAGTEGGLIRETGAQCSKNTNQLNMGEGAKEGVGVGGPAVQKHQMLGFIYAFYF